MALFVVLTGANAFAADCPAVNWGAATVNALSLSWVDEDACVFVATLVSGNTTLKNVTCEYSDTDAKYICNAESINDISCNIGSGFYYKSYLYDDEIAAFAAWGQSSQFAEDFAWELNQACLICSAGTYSDGTGLKCSECPAISDIDGWDVRAINQCEEDCINNGGDDCATQCKYVSDTNNTSEASCKYVVYRSDFSLPYDITGVVCKYDSDKNDYLCTHSDKPSTLTCNYGTGVPASSVTEWEDSFGATSQNVAFGEMINWVAGACQDCPGGTYSNGTGYTCEACPELLYFDYLSELQDTQWVGNKCAFTTTIKDNTEGWGVLKNVSCEYSNDAGDYLCNAESIDDLSCAVGYGLSYLGYDDIYEAFNGYFQNSRLYSVTYDVVHNACGSCVMGTYSDDTSYLCKECPAVTMGGEKLSGLWPTTECEYNCLSLVDSAAVAECQTACDFNQTSKDTCMYYVAYDHVRIPKDGETFFTNYMGDLMFKYSSQDGGYLSWHSDDPNSLWCLGATGVAPDKVAEFEKSFATTNQGVSPDELQTWINDVVCTTCPDGSYNDSVDGNKPYACKTECPGENMVINNKYGCVCDAGNGYVEGEDGGCVKLECLEGEYIYTTASEALCKPCSAGYACPGDGTVTECTGNTYAVAGSTECSECPVGTKPNVGHTACEQIVCKSGEYLLGNECKPCPAGSACSGDGTVTECTGNTYAAAGSTECSECPVGTTANATHTGCEAITCPSGQYLDGNDCVECPAGSACTGDGTVTECTGNTYAAAGATECTECPTGTVSVDNHTACETCPAGYACSGDGTVTECTGNTYSTDGMTMCKECGEGKIAVDNHTACETCPAGYACPGDGTVTECTGNTYAVAGSTECSACPVGTKPNVGHTACEQIVCKTGEYLLGNECKPCPAGYACSGDGTVTECTGNTYSTDGMTMCKECGEGKIAVDNHTACEFPYPDTMERCFAPHAVLAERNWDKMSGLFAECIVKECESGYHVEANMCLLDIAPCELAHGVGEREWNHNLSKWGECVPTKCDPGYTSDPMQGNVLNTNNQCVECRNMYGANGERVVSTYVHECEIATCMYHGEIFAPIGGECELICQGEDETGRHVWNKNTNKCEHYCKDGYLQW